MQRLTYNLAGLAFAAMLVFPMQTGLGAVAKDRVNLLVIGDWGSKVPGPQTTNQAASARALAAYVKQGDALWDAVLATGDNFKVKLKGTEDEYFKRGFEEMYDASILRMPFYAVFGAHDYEYKTVEVQIEYSGRHPQSRWKMRDHFYQVDFPAKDPLVSVLFLDTNRKEFGEKQWKRQMEWLESELGKAGPPWKICIGHHPLFSDGQHGDSSSMQKALGPLLKKHQVDFYICGHDHVLEHLVIPGWETTFLISGGGGENINRPVKANRGFVKATLGFIAMEFGAEAVKIKLIDDQLRVLHAVARSRSGVQEKR